MTSEGRPHPARAVRAAAATLLLLVAGCGTTGHFQTAPAATPRAPGQSGSALTGFQFLPNGSGWLVTQTFSGRNAIWHTVDWGRSWVEVTPQGANQPGVSELAGNAQPISGFDFLTGEDAFVAIQRQAATVRQSSATIYFTGDGGRSWRRVSRVAGGESQVSFLTSQVGFDSVQEGAAAGATAMRLLGTSDGGRRWVTLVSASPAGGPAGGLPLGCDKNAPGWATASTGWMTAFCSGGAALYFFRTTDGGRSWLRQPLPVPKGVPVTDSFDCMCRTSPPRFFGADNGVELVTFYSPQLTLQFAYTTQDGGAQWLPTRIPDGAARVDLVTFRDWVTVAGNRLAETSDAGAHWSYLPAHPSLDGAQLDFTSPSEGFAVMDPQGPRPTLWQTTNGGRDWVRRRFPQ